MTTSNAPMLIIADRNPEHRAAMAAAARRRGYAVLLTQDGEEALWLARTSSPQAVIAELDLPVLGGVELRAALGDGLADLPVLVRVGRPIDARTMREGIEAGVAEFVSKSCPMAALFDRLQQHVSGASVQAGFPWAATAIDEVATIPIAVVRGAA